MNYHTRHEIHTRLEAWTSTTPKPCIQKIDSAYYYPKYDHIYHPQILAIGPYHHERFEGYREIQQLKYTYLKRLLQRTNSSNVDVYVAAVNMREHASQCYEFCKILYKGYAPEDRLLHLLVVDGIFLIEFFRYFHFKSLRDENDDATFRDERLLRQLHRDIVLLENQLPFFLLNELFNMTKTNDAVVDGKDLITLALGFFDSMVPYSLSVLGVWDVKNIDHLFGLRYDSLCHSFIETISSPKHLYISKWENIISASGLREAGIEFLTANGGCNFMDIKFDKGVLIIPQLVVSHEAESHFRNLVVHEQYLLRGKPRCVTDYIFFISCLIKTSNDAELLRSYGIISNRLGTDKEVCQLFTRLGLNTMLSSEFCYSQVFCNVNSHCCRRRNRWKANLWKNYFNSPWSIISFVAASVLLILTLAQTIYTILGYFYR